MSKSKSPKVDRTYRVFVGLGSNLGDRQSYLTKAVRGLAAFGSVKRVSSVYETEPVEFKDQPEYLDLALELETKFEPHVLFNHLKALEKQVGRKHQEHLKPREIDIDILLYEGMSYRDEFIAVPHVKLHRRRFVLEALKEIAPDVVYPGWNVTMAELWKQCSDKSHVVHKKDIVLN
jgi:2-amino-4-hydroxy-6-hydroxymethyldihydropteridine diphosphokinase